MKTDGKVGFLLKEINDSLLKMANNDLRASGLTLMQVALLINLNKRHNREMTMKEIERQFSISQPTVVGIVSRMEEKGIVESYLDSADRRVKIVHITEKGESLVMDAEECVDCAERRLVEGLSDKDIETLLSLLEQMRENLR